MATSEPKLPPWETSPWRSFQEPTSPNPPSIGHVFGVVIRLACENDQMPRLYLHPQHSGYKICSKCNERRRVASFYRQDTGPTGTIYRRSVCKYCALKQGQAWRKANPERSELNRKRSYAKRGTALHLKKRFGITEEQFGILWATCDGRCGICTQPESRKGRRLSLDHDHVTGRLRGFICSACNILLGRAKDKPELLERAASYLRHADLSRLLSSPKIGEVTHAHA